MPNSNNGKSAQDLADQVLEEQNLSTKSLNSSSVADDEVTASDKLAESITHLQNIIERNARELQRIQNELKEKKDSLRSVMENDVQLAEIASQAQQVSQQVKERRAQLNNNPQSMSLRSNIAELGEQKKEIEDTLSNHLVNYYSITNSTSFDTSEGDQWEFKISARVKTKK